MSQKSFLSRSEGLQRVSWSSEHANTLSGIYTHWSYRSKKEPRGRYRGPPKKSSRWAERRHSSQQGLSESGAARILRKRMCIWRERPTWHCIAKPERFAKCTSTGLGLHKKTHPRVGNRLYRTRSCVFVFALRASKV